MNKEQSNRVYDVPMDVVEGLFLDMILTNVCKVYREDDKEGVTGVHLIFRDDENEVIANYRSLYIFFNDTVGISSKS
ncbi:MAG: hypothetical protein SOY97_06090 [Candidatus Metalachnospira sp.]|nr:hypothetical protein [Candidatus Metalachnospira sp.]